MKRRRHRRPPAPRLLVTYITLAEVQAKAATLPPGQQLVVPFDLIAPADKKRIAERNMCGFDDLPRAVREAISYASSPGHLPLAVNLIAKGKSAAQTAETIFYRDSVLMAKRP